MSGPLTLSTMRNLWAAQPQYTGGETVLYWDGTEMIVLRMVDASIGTAARAADNLGARYFFRQIGHDKATMTDVWGGYDRADFAFNQGTTVWSGVKTKTFKTNDMAPLIMWAAAKGGR